MDQENNNKITDPNMTRSEAAINQAANRSRKPSSISRAMVAKDDRDPASLSFSQAQGYEDVPGPLKLEELDGRERNRIWNTLYVHLNSSRKTDTIFGSSWVTGDWEKVLKVMHCSFDDRALDDWDSDFDTNRKALRRHIEKDPFYRVFDRLQFIMRTLDWPGDFIRSMKVTFEECRLAYAIDKGPPPTILPVATPQEGAALIESLQTLHQAGLRGCTSHLRNAAQSINQRDWAGGVRESIHAVESVARKIDPDAARTLTPALKSIEKSGTLHPALKNAFTKLYAYTSDEQGIRHALLDGSSAKAGMDEAVFMLGACASFASYLWRKHVAGAES